MTDSTTRSPRTEAGRLLLKVSANQRKNTDSWADHLPERIAAIEAEAAASDAHKHDPDVCDECMEMIEEAMRE